MSLPPESAPTYATPEQVAAWVGITDPDEALTLITATANYTVAGMIGTATIPEEIARHATLALAADLESQRSAPNGIRLFSDGAGGIAPLRVRADAAGRARAILAPFLAPVLFG